MDRLLAVRQAPHDMLASAVTNREIWFLIGRFAISLTGRGLSRCSRWVDRIGLLDDEDRMLVK